MAETLFDMSFRAWNAPVQAEIAQQQLALDKQAVQSNQFDLQNKIALQQDMQRIWGTGGPDANGAAAVAGGDLSQSPKFIATAQALAMRGQPQAAASYLSGLSMLGLRAAETKKYQQQVEWRHMQMVGSALGAVTGPQDYPNAIAQIRAEGVDPATLGLSGSWELDGPRLPALARSSMTRAQQLQAQDRETAETDRNTQRDISNGFVAQRIGQANRSLDLRARGLDQSLERFHWAQKEGDKRDARAQEGLRLKELGAEDRSFANASRLQKPEADIAVGVFGNDVRTKDMDPNLQKSLATLAARRAKQQIAQNMMASGDVEYEPEDFGAALADQMDLMQRQGMFNTEGDYSFKPPKAGPPTPMPRPGAAAAKAEGNTLEKMAKDPRAIAIKNNASMSLEEKKAALAKLGY